MFRFHWTATIMALVLMAAPTSAQPRPAKQYKRGDPLELRGEKNFQRPIVVRVAAARFVPREEPSLQAAAYPGATGFEFLAEAYLAATEQDTGFSFLALTGDRKTIKEPLGWVPTGLLVFADEARKLPGGNVHEKAVIVNTVDSIQEDRTFLTLPKEFAADFDVSVVSDQIKKAFQDKKNLELSDKAKIQVSPFDATVRLIMDDAPGRFYRFEVRPNPAGEMVVMDSYGMAAVDDNPFPRDGAKDGLPPPVRRSAVRLANTFYVYAVYPSADKPTHYLLGLSSNIKVGEAPEVVIKGWVPHTRIRPWNTGEALRWANMPPDREPGVVLASREGADNWWKDKEKKKLVKQVVTETPGIKWAPYTARMLVLSGHEPKVMALGQDPVPMLFEVAVPGVLNTQTGTIKSGGVDVAAIKAKLSALYEGSKKLDIVFVIDDSQRMESYFKPVGDIVEEVLKDALINRETVTPSKPGTVTRLRVGITFYSDYEAGKPVIRLAPTPDGQPGPKMWEIFNSQTSAVQAANNLRRLVGDIKGHQFRPGGDDPDQLFQGIYDAVDEVQDELAQAPLARRVMILIGDMASHPLRLGKKELTDTEAITAMVKKLNPNPPGKAIPGENGENPFEFYAVRVEGNDSNPKARRLDAIRMRTQMLDLCDALNARYQEWNPNPEKPSVVARFFPDGGREKPEAQLPLIQVEELTKALRARFLQIRADQERLIGGVSALQAGEWPASPYQLDPRVVSALRAAGLDPQQLAKTDAFEIYLTGYVWRYMRGGGEQKQVQTEFFLAEGELDQLIYSLDAFVGATRDVLENPTRFQTLYTEQLKALAREDRSFVSFADAFKSKFGIITRTNFLQKTRTDLTEGLKADGLEIAELRQKVERLKDTRAGYDRPIKIEKVGERYRLTIPELDDKYRLKEPNYFTQPGSSVKYYWIPIDELP